ncbi:arginine--tRNA ligase [soil metagenome]
MPSFPQLLVARLTKALDTLGLPTDVAAVTTATDPRFGHYQSNAAMVIGKQQKENPRLIAQRLADVLAPDDTFEKPEVAGPGFLNFRISPAALQARLAQIAADPKLGVAPSAERRRIVIDFSAPNIAKPMHVGHLRSTIIGDSLARVARFLGHHVITDNHIGDWGTQFGMIVFGWKHYVRQDALQADPITELVRVYREVNAKAKAIPAFRDACKDELVKLQAGDPENLAIWKRAVALSLDSLRNIYSQLDIHFDHFLGESAYNDRLASLVDKLIADGTATESDGAICIFFPEKSELADKPFLIRKADGGFLYSTTDLATIDYRLGVWGADDIWYIVGDPQSLHFRQLFAAARLRGQEAGFAHVAHGSILGKDRKLMRTRSGESVGLTDVLDEAIARARTIVDEKNPDLPEAEKAAIAETIGIGSVKYAELSQHRMTNYVFDWDKMLALNGATAPYLQNSYVRIRSIFRRLGEPFNAASAASAAPLVLEDPQELSLAFKLAQFAEVVPEVLHDFRPNVLALYLLELARGFHSFYEACPVLRSEGTTRTSRLVLCDATSRILAQGLDLLGIRVTERM